MHDNESDTNVLAENTDQDLRKKQLKETYNSRWIMKNLITLSFVFLFTFLAYNGLGSLQVMLQLCIYLY